VTEQTQEEQVRAELAELADRKAAIQKRRETRAEKESLAHARQEVIDLTRIDELEEEHGDKRVAAAPLNGWTPGVGAVTRIAVVVPKRSDRVYQRFQQQVIRFRKDEVKTIAAIEQLARMVLAYPHPERDKDAFDATYELAPVMMNTAATMAQTLADADDKADAKK
jgi:hypothetical protein